MRGYIKQRSAGSWRIQIELPRAADGSRQREGFTVRGTRREAEQKMAQRIAEIGKGQYARNQRKETVETYLRAWLESKEHGEKPVAPTTLQRYRELCDQINTVLGPLPLKKLGRIHVKDALKKWRNTPRGGKRQGTLSQRTVHHLFATLRSALYAAQHDGLIAVNPCANLDVIKGRSNVSALDERGALHLIQGLAGDPLCSPVIFAILTGLRRGELLALRWDDIDLRRRVVYVRRSLEVIGSSELRFKEPKTPNSIRSIALPQQAVDLLQRHKVEQDMHKRLHADRYADSGLVFCLHNGNPWNPKRFSSRFERKVRQLKLPKVSVHGLRHTFATLQLLSGTDLKVASALLGHSSVAITADTYQHVMGGLNAEAAARMERLLAAADPDGFLPPFLPPKRLRLVKKCA